MLRWCQSTVHRALDGRASTTISTTRLFSAGPLSRESVTGAASGNRSSVRHGTLKRQQATRPTILSSINSAPSLPVTVVPPLSTKPLSPTEKAARGNSKLSLEDALGTLRRVLSPSPEGSAKTSMDTLIECYHYVKSRHALKMLTSKELTAFMSLLGTLSVTPLPRRCIYFSTLSTQVEIGPDRREYWELVVEVGRAKEKLLGSNLNGTDRFWIMRGLLGQVRMDGVQVLDPDHSYWSLLKQATNQYLQIWKHTPDPEIHVPYFQALFSTRSETGLAMLVPRLCRVLEIHKNPHSSILDILWRVVLERVHDLTTEQQHRILAMLSTRLDNIDVAAEPGPTPTPKSMAALSIGDLSAALGNAIFPGYSPGITLPLEVQQWAKRRAAITFSPSTPAAIRASQLIPLVICKLPESRLDDIAYAHDIELINALEWRTVLLLSFMETVVNSRPAHEPIEDVHKALDATWESWLSTDHGPTVRPINVTRAIISAFVFIASKTNNAFIVRACSRFCTEHDLFRADEPTCQPDKLQVIDLRVGMIAASVATRTATIRDVLAAIEETRSCRPVEILAPLFRHSAHHDPNLAFAIYRHGWHHHKLVFPPKYLFSMCQGLIRHGHFTEACHFLRNPTFTSAQHEHLFGSMLEAFRRTRKERIDTSLSKSLSEAMLNFYRDNAPSLKLKWPIRYYFQVAILSYNPSVAFKLIETVHAWRPEFFNPRLFLRLLRAFFRRRAIRLASRLTRFLPIDNTPASRDFHRKALFLLTRAGAHAQARRLYDIGVGRMGHRTGRELIARAVGFRIRNPPFVRVLAVSSILKRHLSDQVALKLGFEILIRSGRFKACRSILDQVHQHIDTKLKTSLCNTYIHGYLDQHNIRNGRVVRHCLRVQEQFERLYDFNPDRTTINIIMKALLRWRRVTSKQVQELFDDVIRCGFPASARWRRVNGAPFGTAIKHATRVPYVTSLISYKHHVRPLYKLFIKAFHARGDQRAARVVIIILQEEEVNMVLNREEAAFVCHKGLRKSENTT